MSLFLTYLRSELRRRARQAIVIALGLAVGIGLVITVTATATGVRNGQASVLRALYGVGTDITVTRPWSPSTGTAPRQQQDGPGSPAQHTDYLMDAGQGLFASSAAAAIAALPHVAASASWLALVDQKISTPAGGGPGVMTSTTVDGVDAAGGRLGPLSQATVVAGRGLRPADANANVALVDSGYATTHRLRTGSVITLANVPFRVIGIVRQPAGSDANALIPIARAQQLAGVPGEVNTVSVAADSAARVPAVSKAIKAALPWADVTSSATLAGEITGSLDNAARLASDLGRWVAIAALAAAVAMAGLLTMAAVSRRVRDIGTLKALGWRSGRIVGQLLGESAVIGVAGALAGVVLGLGGATLVSALAPNLTATVAYSPGAKEQLGQLTQTQNGVSHNDTFVAPGTYHNVPVHFSAPVAISVVLLAVALALAGALLAGALGGWRAARLRPALALSDVA